MLVGTTAGQGGYKAIDLRYNGARRRVYVHRIIAKLFIPNPDNLPQVNHIDGNKHNNNVNNLEWCTASHNRQHAADVLGEFHGERNGMAVLTTQDVIEIRVWAAVNNISQRSIATAYSVSPMTISRIVNNQSWRRI